METNQTVEAAPVTEWLHAACAGDTESLELLASWAYRELELLAARRLRRQFRGPVTLEPAGLVNETFAKLMRHPLALANRRHFFSYMSQIMMRVLLDYRRRRDAIKRGRDAVQVTLDGVAASDGALSVDALALEQAFERLADLDRRKAEVARLRTLWGMTAGEIAEVLEVSEPTVRRDWRFSRNWLAESLATPA